MAQASWGNALPFLLSEEVGLVLQRGAGSISCQLFRVLYECFHRPGSLQMEPHYVLTVSLFVAAPSPAACSPSSADWSIPPGRRQQRAPAPKTNIKGSLLLKHCNLSGESRQKGWFGESRLRLACRLHLGGCWLVKGLRCLDSGPGACLNGSWTQPGRTTPGLLLGRRPRGLGKAR